jgi:hypothetical protein
MTDLSPYSGTLPSRSKPPAPSSATAPSSTAAGTFQNLNSLIPAGSGYQLEDATTINDHGQMVLNAYDTVTNQNRALLLSPS